MSGYREDRQLPRRVQEIMPSPPARPLHVGRAQRAAGALKRIGSTDLRFYVIAGHADDTRDVLLQSGDPRKVLAEARRLGTLQGPQVWDGGAAGITRATIRDVEMRELAQTEVFVA